MADNTTKIVIDGDVAPLRRAMLEARAAVEGFGKDGAKSLQGMDGPLVMLHDNFVRVGGLLAGGALGAGMLQLITSAADAQDKLNDLSKSTAISVEDLSGLAHAAKQSGTDLDGIAKSVNKLSVEMGKDPERYRRLGVTAREPIEAFKQLADAIVSIEDPQKRAAVAQAALGKSWQDAMPLLAEGGRKIGEMVTRGRELSGATAESAAEADKFNDQLEDLRAAASGAGIALANPLIASLNTTIARMKELSAAGHPVLAMLRGIAGLGKLPFDAILGNVDMTKGGQIKDLQAELGKIAATQAQIQKNRFWAADPESVKTMEDLTQRAGVLKNQIDALNKYDLTPKAAAPEKKGSPDVAGFLGASGGKTGGSSGGKSSAPASMMDHYEAQLAKEKAVASEKNALREYSKAQELAYWQTISQAATLSEKDRIAVERKVATLTVDVRRAAAKQTSDIDADNLRSHEALALGRVDAAQAATEALAASEQITRQQALALEEQYEQERFAIKRSALQQKLALYEADPDLNPVEMARLKNQLLELEQQYQIKKNQQQGKSMQLQMAESQKSTQIWTDLGSSFSSLWDKGINAMMNGTLRWRNATQAIGTEMVGWFARSVVGRMLQEWIAGKAAEFAVSMGWMSKEQAVKLGFLTQQQMTDAAAAAQQIVTQHAVGATGVMSNSAVAATAAMSSVAAIPFVGWAMAPGVGAATYAAGLAYLASARDGYDIPAGLNPLTQLHEREMVLPAEHSDVIRGLAQNGGSASGMSVTINAVDGASVERLFRSNGHVMAKELRRQARNFAPTRS